MLKSPMPHTHTSEHLQGGPVPSDEKVYNADMLPVAHDILRDIAKAPAEQEAIGRAIAFVEHMAMAEHGTPFVRLRPGHNNSYQRVIDEGGRLSAPVSLQRLPRGWRFVVTLDRYDYAGQLAQTSLALTPTEILQGCQNKQPHVAVGEQDVRQLLQSNGLYCLQEPAPTQAMLQADSQWLGDVARTGLPLDFLGFTHNERAAICEHLADSILTSKSSSLQGVSYRALQFVAAPETQRQKTDLLEVLNSQMADLLPLKPDDDPTPIYTSFGLAELQPLPLLLCEKLPDGSYKPPLKRPGLETFKAAYLSNLYRERASSLEQQGMGTEEEITIPAWPTRQINDVPRQALQVFLDPYPSSSQIHQDVAYLLKLRQSGVPSTPAITRNFDTMRHARISILKQVGQTPSLQERVNMFCALEYLFELERPEQREYFYELMRLQHSYHVPVNTFTSLRGQTNVAEAMAVVMPNPPLGKEAPRFANAAALMADFYTRKALQLLAKDLRTRRAESLDPLGFARRAAPL